jgi:hypothetical protein
MAATAGHGDAEMMVGVFFFGSGGGGGWVGDFTETLL